MRVVCHARVYVRAVIKILIKFIVVYSFQRIRRDIYYYIVFFSRPLLKRIERIHLFFIFSFTYQYSRNVLFITLYLYKIYDRKLRRLRQIYDTGFIVCVLQHLTKKRIIYVVPFSRQFLRPFINSYNSACFQRIVFDKTVCRVKLNRTKTV